MAARSFTEWRRGCLLLFTLLAFGLRLYRLDQRSLWTDEGLSVYRARLSPADILSGEIVIQGTVSQDTQPPLYFLMLHLQRRLVGESSFGLKFPSAAWGALVVPLLYALGRRLFSPGTGLATALLGAASPFYLWYSQEMRMYPMLVALSALSVYALLRALGVGRAEKSHRWWPAYLLSTAAALYTHYTAFFLLGFEIVVMLGLAIWQRKRGVLIFAALAVAAGLPLLPYVLWRLQFAHEARFNFVPLPLIVTSVFRVFATGFITQLPHLDSIQLGMLVPFLAGLILPPAATKTGKWWGRTAFLAGWLALPTLALFAVSLYKPIFQGPRHLIVISLAFYLTLGRGVTALWRRWRPAGALVLIGILAAIVPLWQPFYQNQAFLKDDWRGLAAYVARHARPGDVMLINDAVLLKLFDYYLSDALPLTALPRYGYLADESTVTTLENMAERYNRIWFVPQLPADGRDDDRLVERWLESNLTQVDDRGFHGLDTLVVVRCYTTPSPQIETLPDSAARLDVAWGNDLLLQGYQVPGQAASGGVWRLVFYWSKLRPEAGEYILSLRLTDERGKVWAQSEEDLWRFFPPAAWPMETTIRQDFDVEWPAGLPPGKYQVWLRIVSAQDDQPLPASGGGVDVLLMPELMVKSATAADESHLPPHTPRRARLGNEIDLLGYHLRAGHHRPGHMLYLDLYWRVRHTPTADYRLRLQLLDEAGQIVGETITSPTRVEYPPTRWQPDELLYGKVELLIPPQAEAGFHRLCLSLVHPETGEPLPIRVAPWPWSRESLILEEVQVVEWPMVTEIPPLQTPLRADFGAPALIELHGYDLTAAHDPAGSSLTLTLYWRARARMDTGYTVFIHLADADEAMAGQGDGVPDRGFRLTTSWREGEVISDTHVIPIRPDAPPGAYRLWVGLYDPSTDQRLPAFVDGERRPGDRVLLDIVPIKP